MNNTALETRNQPQPLTRSCLYERWTAVPYRDLRDHKQTAGNENLVFQWVTAFIGSTPTETLELEFAESWEFCSMTKFTSNKEIAHILELPVDSVKKAKNLLVKKGWIGQTWFKGNDRSGRYKLGVPQAQKSTNLGCDRSGKNLPDATYSNIEQYNSPDKTNTNARSDSTKKGEFKKPKSIDQGKLDKLNKSFAERTSQQPDDSQKRFWSKLWPKVIGNIRSALKFRYNQEIGHSNAIETLLKIMPQMQGREQLARHPTWFIKTQSNGQEGHSWGLDFIFKHYPHRNQATNFDDIFWYAKSAHEKQQHEKQQQEEQPQHKEIKNFKPNKMTISREDFLNKLEEMKSENI